jgi:LemA protein
LLLLLFWLFYCFYGIGITFLWNRYNAFIGGRNQVKTDFADIDVQLKRRAALIENLVEVVKAYAKHEKDTFEEVAKARSALNQSSGAKDLAQADNSLTRALRSVFAVSEAYPKLQASENFKQLHNDLKETEDMIAQYRETYNQSVLDYNTMIQVFPNLLVAGLFGFKQEELYQPDESDRTDIKID